MTTRPFSLYVHVPFCAQKCPYCDFNTYAVEKIPEREYVQAVRSEITAHGRDEAFLGRVVETVFFGGGTPSLFSGAAIASILESITNTFSLSDKAEITVEANPNVADATRLPAYRAAGVNRISFGVQSFQEHFLQLLGRNHSAREAIEAVSHAYGAGIHDISVDLMYGLPGQTMHDLALDLNSAGSLPITHLSTYSLTIEPGTPFFQRQERGLLKGLPDHEVAEMLEAIPGQLERHGFERYEISNYARAGKHSRHNSTYWTGGDYLGVGAGAHSYIAQYSSTGVLETARRWSTLALPAAYMKGASSEIPVSWRESLDQKACMFEFFYLGLRRTVGVSVSSFKKLFGEHALAPYEDTLRELCQEGFLKLSGDAILLTTKGISLADSVFERFAGLPAR